MVVRYNKNGRTKTGHTVGLCTMRRLEETICLSGDMLDIVSVEDLEIELSTGKWASTSEILRDILDNRKIDFNIAKTYYDGCDIPDRPIRRGYRRR